MVIYGATVTIEDLQDPAFNGSHGVATADGTWHNDSAIPVTLAEADDNTGIRQRRALIGTEVVHTWAAPGCGVLNSGIAYTYAAPCAGDRGLNAEMATTLPLAGVADGVRTLEFSAVDTGGREVVSESFTIKVDRVAPRVSVAAPGSLADGQALGFEASFSDSTSGVVASEKQMSIDGGGWQELGGRAAAGRSYRFRARAGDAAGNVSAWRETGAVQVPASETAKPEPAPEPPTPEAPGTPAAPGTPVAPETPVDGLRPPTAILLPASPAPQPETFTARVPGPPRITLAQLARATVRVAGTLPAAATGTLIVTFAARIKGRTAKATTTATPERGRWRATLALPRKLHGAREGTLRIRYAGDAALAPATTRKTLARK